MNYSQPQRTSRRCCLLWPFQFLGELMAAIIRGTGRLMAAILGLLIVGIGVLISMTVIGMIIGIPLIVFGVLLLIRSLF